VISGATILALNESDGKLIWQSNLKEDILSYFQSGESLWLYNYHQIISIDINSGKIQGEFLIPEKYISVTAVYNNMLFTSVYDSTKQEQEIVCYDIKNQKANWTLSVGSSLKSAIYYDNDNLFFTTEKAFYKIDINSGSVITNILLADTIQANTLVFDIIKKKDYNFIIARENSLFIISEKEKTPKLTIPFGNSHGFTPTYIQNKLNEMKLAKMPERNKSSYNTLNFYTDRTYSSLARQHQNWVYSTTASTLAYNSNASTSERISALDRRELAARGSYNSGQIEAYSQLVNSYAQLGAAVGSLIGYFVIQKTNKAFVHILDYMERKIQALILYQTQCINGNFYMRPYFEDGWRLAVIDIKNFGYTSIPMTPDLLPLRISYTGSVVYSVFSRGDKQYLLVKGLKPLPREVTAVYNIKCGNVDNNRLSDWTVPKPSLICYDITDIETDNKFPPLNSIKSNAKAIDKELIEAAFLTDLDKAEELLKKGADVNATDEFGHTALMHACQTVNKKMVKILLQAGANPKIEDPEGLNANSYVSLEFPSFTKDVANIWKQLKKAWGNFN